MTIHMSTVVSYIPWVALALALISVLLQSIYIARTKRSVKISIERNIRVMGSAVMPPHREGVDYISVNITNNGTRRIAIDTVGAKLSNGSFVVPMDILRSGAIVLEEGKKSNVLIEESKINFAQVSYFYAKDTNGKVYKKYVNTGTVTLRWVVALVILLIVLYGLAQYVTMAMHNGTASLFNGFPGSKSVAQDSTTVLVSIGNGAFSPSQIMIHKGTTVIWINTSQNPQTVTSDQDENFSSPTLKQGDSYRNTFVETGVFTYHSQVNPNMKGTITIVE